MNFHCKHPLHKTLNITIIIFILVISFTHVFGQQTAKRTGGTPNIGFLEHLPADYASNSSKTYPVLIFFHGASEKGSGSAADLEKIKVQGPPMHIENGDDMCFTVNGRQHCFIVISPQLPTGEDEWSNTYTTKVIDYVLANYRVNTSRLYLTGLSLGAHGIYLLAKQNGAGNAYIPKIAAVVNASGACPVYELDASKFVPVPLWAFHNETDPVVKINNERLFLQRINNLNPAKPPVFSVFNVSNHNTWTKAYQLSRSNWTSYNEFQNSSSSSVQSTNSYEWLLTHCKGNCNDGPADTMPFPTGLTASMVNGNVKLQWNDNASNETAYILERRIVGCDNTGSGTAPAPNFVAVAELPANSTSFTDDTPSQGCTYEYRIKASNATQTSAYSQIVNIKVETDIPEPPVTGLTRRMLIDLGAASTQTTGTGWSNSTHGFTGNISSLKDQVGGSTGISFVIATSAEGGYDNNGIGVNPEGYKGAVGSYPKSAAQDSYYAYGSTPGVYKLTGLDNNKVYEITLFGSRTVTGTNSLSRVGVYTIAGVSKTLDALNNTSRTVTFSNLNPQNGEFSITFKAQDPAGFGYINFMDVKEFMKETGGGDSLGTTPTVIDISPNKDGWLEAECAMSAGSSWHVNSDTQASNGTYMEVLPGYNSFDVAPSSIGVLEFTVNVLQAGNYKLWARVKCTNSGNDSFWVRGDNGTWINWSDVHRGSVWNWDTVQNTASNRAHVAFNWSAGQHTVQFAYREDGTQLDKLYLTTGNSAPSGLGQTAGNCGSGDVDSPVAGLNRRMLIDLGADSTQTTITGWSNSTNGFTDNISSLQDDKGASSGIGFVIATSAEGGYDQNGIGVNPEGYKGAVGSYPKSAAQDSYYAYGSTPGVYKLTGLDNSKVYEITLFGSRTVTGTNTISRVGVYTIAGVSKTLDALNNASNTIAFNNLTPQNGEISLSFKAQDPAGFGYINFIDVKEFTPAADALGVPTALIVSSVTANSVSLSWTDNASQETGFEIERKSGTDSYAKITTTAANIASYTDNTVTTDVTYYYRIRAINQTAASAYSAEVIATPNAAGGNPTVLRKFLLDLGADSTQTTTAGWNNGTNGTITGANISNLQESNGNSSSINFVIVRPADNDYEEIEANLTGRPGVNPDGCKNCDLTYPVSATQDSYFAWGTTPGSYKFTGLDNTKKYNLRIFASRMSTNSETRIGLYQINGESKTLDAKNNITNTITFTDLVPASGELVLSFGVATGSKFAYINTLELEEVGATTTPVDPPVAGLNRRMLLDLGADSTQTIATGWSNSTHGFTGNISSLQDDKGATTGISFVIATSAEGGYDNNGIGVNPEGYKGAVGSYPKSAAQDSYYAYGSTPGVYKLTGLDNSKVYEITLFGSRTVTGTNSISRVGVYTIAGVAKTLNALNNTSQTVTFGNLIPQNGEISITFKAQDPAGFGYINFIDIKEYTPGTDPGEPGDPVLDYTLLVNFTDGSTTGDASWNNTNAAPARNLAFSNLKDDQGNNQNVSITLTSAGFAANDKGMVTGNNSGAAPDDVLKTYYYTSSASGETMKVSGLQPEMKYRFTFIVSNSYTGDRTGIYSIGDQSVSLNAAQNSSKTVNIDQVVPNGNGEVIITVKRAASASYAFLNALKIEGFGTGGGGTPVVTRQMLMDLGADSTRTTGIGWSNSTQGFTGNISSLQDDKGASTSIGFVIVTSAEGGFDNNGIGVNPDGYKGAVGSYPKSAAQDSYYAYGSTPGVYKLTGLDNNRRYELILFASRMVSGNNNLNRTGVYTIAGETKSLDALNNSSKTVTFSNVTPQNGEISITFKAQDPTGFGYLNFVDIKEYTQGTGPLDPDTPDYTSPPVIESVADQTLYTEVSYSLQLKASQGKATSGKDKLNIVVLGSSTAEGYNLVDKSYSFVGLLSSYMNTTYPGSTVTNLGKGGYTTYHVLPDGTSATANRPPVDPERNITKALSLNPDLIVISLPSNDLAGGFADQESIDNLRTVKTMAEQQGVVVYISTTQPRNNSDFTAAMSQALSTKAQKIRDAFGSDVIDIYDELATADYKIKDQYAVGNGLTKTDYIHINYAGHRYIFDRLKPMVDRLLQQEATGNASSEGIVFTATSLPAFASFTDSGNGNATITFTPAGSDADTQGSITVRATNPGGIFSEVTFTYQVLMQGVLVEDAEDVDFKAQYNGNIAAMRWNTFSYDALIKQKAYAFDYDKAGRLTAARYAAKSTPLTGWNSDVGYFNVQDIKYDANGNLGNLYRIGEGKALDRLEYNYFNAQGQYTNQLQSVLDGTGNAEGFKDGANAPHEYGYDQNGNLIRDDNKGITNIRYNYLNLPEEIAFSNGNKIVYIYDAAGNKLSKQVITKAGSSTFTSTTDYVGGIQYSQFSGGSKKLDFISHAEGRATLKDGAYAYQYDLKDHLGNTRLTFSENRITDTYLSTMEPELASEEVDVFTAKVTETRHLNAGANATEPAIEHPSPQYAARLNAVPGYAQTVGPTLSLAVRKGDVIKAQVQAYYEAAIDNNTLPSQSLVPSIVAAFAGTGIVDGQVIQSALNAASGTIAVGSVLKTDNNYLPHAYLNYILFDENFVYVDAGYQRVTGAANMAHETLSREITASQNGYIFVYVSNESKWDVNVFFDDLKIEHEHIDIVQHDDYYPFGLRMAGRSYVGGGENRYLFAGKELQDELGLDWYDFGNRVYDPTLGRFNSVDRFASKYVSLSPYNYAANNPILLIDINGDSLDIGSITSNKLLYASAKMFAQSKDGLQFLSQFAKKGQTAFGHTFDQDGAFHKEGVNLAINAKSLGKRNAVNGQTDFEVTDSGLNINIDLNSDLNSEGFYSSDAASKLESTIDARSRGEASFSDIVKANEGFWFERLKTLTHESYQHAERFATDFSTGGASLLNSRTKRDWGILHHSLEGPSNMTNYRTKGQRILQSANSKLGLKYTREQIINIMY